MADDPKIIPSPPPAEPFDVRVNPDPPPAEPFDVPTYPDPPPAKPFPVEVAPSPPPRGTFDVKTTPSGPPFSTVDVPTNQSGPPFAPFDVATYPDLPPRPPFDVPTVPDGPPAVPFDVSVIPDGPPAEPFDVNTNESGPPAIPFDVPTVLDAPPTPPFDVSVSPDLPPAAPFDVSTILSSPPFEPFDVPTYPDPPPSQIEYDRSGRPTLASLIAVLGSLDSDVGKWLARIDDLPLISPSQIGGAALDPLVLADWFRTYANTVGAAAVGKFVAEQELLYAMNPEVARVFNPLYFVNMSIPGSMGHVHTTIDTQAGITSKTVAEARDALLVAKVSATPSSDFNNAYGRDRTMNDGQDFTIDELVDVAIDGGQHPFVTDESYQVGLSNVKRFDASKYFDSRGSDGGMRPSSAAQLSITANPSVQSRESNLVASNFLNGVIRVPISHKEEPDGAVYSETQDPSAVVDDDDARVPLCFTDLRKDPVRNAYRSVYFRPLNLSFSNSVSPEWAEGSAFGRVDPVVGYQRTTRAYSVSFDMHAFAPEDLRVMYHKMTWLTSMCYPTYGSDSLMRSGPVIRMRIGDAVSTDSGGLTGVLRNLSFDFADALWELKSGLKVPRSFKVSLDFLALHEGPVGILDGVFGVFQFPESSTQQDVDTDQEPGTGESRDETPRVATITTGRFSKFGEPQR